MKKFYFIGIVLLGVLVIVSEVFAWDINASRDIRNSGEIHGIASYCGPSGSAGLEVYIPGRSFIVKTGVSGEFTLCYVPEGTYNLVFLLSNNVIHTLMEVQVVRKTTTELGTLTICPDNDNDTYDVSVDCNDFNPNIHPGAEEICNGVDDNCDGNIDEGVCLTCDDNDGDGYYAQPGCPGSLGVDCDDSNGSINPGAQEVCFDGIDNNCDNQIDEGCPACNPGEQCDTGLPNYGVCVDVIGFYDENCNCIWEVPDAYNPDFDGCDGLDNDCDGQTDEDCVTPGT